jgi:hypothetical protein
MPITSRMAQAKFCLAREKLDENAITRTATMFTKGMTMRSTTPTQLATLSRLGSSQRWDGNWPAA